MKKNRKFLGRPAVTAGLLILALGLLLGSTIGGIRADLTLESEYHKAQAQLAELDIKIVENGKEVSGSDALLQDLLSRAEDTKLRVGKKYEETLAVKNSGDADEYVRVTVYKYWIDEKGEKFPEMDSKWIIPGFETEGKWSIDTASTTEERTVLYYSEILEAGKTSDPFITSITIDDDATKQVTQTTSVSGNVTVITTTYDYNGKQFCLEVYADGVQTHNASDAKISAWGLDK